MPGDALALRGWLVATLPALLVACGTLRAEPGRAGRPVESIRTPNGLVSIWQQDGEALGRRYSVEYDQHTLLTTDQDDDQSEFADFPKPVVLLNGPAADHGYVVVFQQLGWGNACNGGPLWVLDVDAAGNPRRTQAIPYCGDQRVPEVAFDGPGVSIKLPCTPGIADQDIATGVAYERWQFRQGQVVQLSDCARSSGAK